MGTFAYKPLVQDFVARHPKPVLLIGGALLIACVALILGGGDAHVGGLYSNPARNYGFDFRADGTASYAGGGPSMRYWVSGKTVYVEMPDGLQSIHVMDEDTLKVAAKEPRQIMRDRSYICSDAKGEIGTLLLQNSGRVFLTALPGSPHAKDGPQAFGTYKDSGSEITLKDPSLANVFRYRGTGDLKAETVTCKRI